jgi:maltose O-acetyltransferase
MTERDRMRAGAPYNSRDPELLALAHRARALLTRFGALASTSGEARASVLRDLLGGVGDGVWIEPPFFCDYGAHITIGAHTFVNVNVVMLDSADITIGARVLIGPGAQLLTATHPLAMAERLPVDWTPASGRGPYVTMARPIIIGDGAWIGAGALLMPGVTVGEGAVIGAGSVVTQDVPPHTVVAGNPARVIRTLDSMPSA